MTSIFNTSWEYPRMHVWCKFGDSSPNLWRVIARTSHFLEFWVKMAQWPRRSRWMTSIFNTSWEYPRMHVWCKFGDSSTNLWRVIARTSHFLEFWVKMAKWPRRSRSMTSIFNTRLKYPKMHVWCKFGYYSPNLWRVITRTSQIS